MLNQSQYTHLIQDLECLLEWYSKEDVRNPLKRYTLIIIIVFHFIAIGNDAAILKLEQALDLTEYTPACLARVTEGTRFYDIKATAVGWGSIAALSEGPYHPSLHPHGNSAWPCWLGQSFKGKVKQRFISYLRRYAKQALTPWQVEVKLIIASASQFQVHLSWSQRP